ncbi:MAG TPA: preprotein translocase subunit YajC [Xanthomonadaceae bacterium]|jgi:preprotein translocase subunit YajC|nr:preprotein translocase subunit YajC [Xanthomonadaceae bacterium]
MNPLDLLIPVAHAQAASAAAPNAGMMNIVLLVAFVGVFIFIVILPQSKRAKQHRELLAKLQKGDEVVTNGGVAGRVAEIGDAFITLEVADGVQVKFQRMAISMVLPRGSLKAS